MGTNTCNIAYINDIYVVVSSTIVAAMTGATSKMNEQRRSDRPGLVVSVTEGLWKTAIHAAPAAFSSSGSPIVDVEIAADPDHSTVEWTLW